MFARVRIACFAVLAVIVFGCGSSNGDVGFDPRNAEEFEPATDPDDQRSLIDEMLRALITPPGECWDASVIVGGMQPTGIVSQWQFDADEFGNVFFRFVGFDTTSGTVFLQNIGRYNGWPTALVETWTGGPEALILLSPDELVHVSVNPGGGLSTVRYGMGRGTCL